MILLSRGSAFWAANPIALKANRRQQQMVRFMELTPADIPTWGGRALTIAGDEELALLECNKWSYERHEGSHHPTATPLVRCISAMTAASSSDTPILDSAVMPRRKKSSSSMLYGFLVGILFALIIILNAEKAQEARNPASAFIVIFYLTSIVLAVIIHEAGHLLAGWAVGLRFNSITIGPVSLHIEYGRPKVRVRRAFAASGYAGMHIDRVRRLRRRLFVFASGGPAANLISAVVVGFTLPHLAKENSWSSLFAGMFWMMSLLLGLANLVPARIGFMLLDGARLWMLFSSKTKSRRWFSVCAVGSQSLAGTKPRNYRRTWLRAGCGIEDRSVDDFAGNWAAYIAANDRKDVGGAAHHLEVCLRQMAYLGPAFRDLVALEAGVFTAWFRGDVSVAQKWLDNIKAPKALPQLMRMRSEIALCCARKEYSSALSRWEDTIATIEKLPATPVKNRLIEGFREWRDEIRERTQATLAPADSV